MKMQVYTVTVAPEVLAKARPAQFIYKNNDSDDICGFIQNVNKENGTAIFVLFEPTEAIPEATVIVEQGMTSQDIQSLLYKALLDKPEMREYWAILLSDNIDEQ